MVLHCLADLISSGTATGIWKYKLILDERSIPNQYDEINCTAISCCTIQDNAFLIALSLDICLNFQFGC